MPQWQPKESVEQESEKDYSASESDPNTRRTSGNTTSERQ